jgi:hypothetical protein
MKKTSRNRIGNDGLNLREALFARLYLINRGNGKQAAEQAGYRGDCKNRASQLLAKPKVAAVIQREGAKLVAKLEVKAERVLQEVCRVAFFDCRRLFNADNTTIPIALLDEDTAAGLAGINFRKGAIRFRFANKLQALDLLGQHLKLWDGAGNLSTNRLHEVLAAFKAGPVDTETDAEQNRIQ